MRLAYQDLSDLESQSNVPWAGIVSNISMVGKP
jgi:hypothetical protein